MAVTAPTEGPDELVTRVQDLQARLAASGDPATRRVAEELVSAIVQMYGEGPGADRRARCTPAARRAGGSRPRSATTRSWRRCSSSTTCTPCRSRCACNEALEHVRPYMESHGGNVELLSLEDGVARIRLEGSCSDCSASAVTLELAIKQALEQAAPDLDGLEVEGVARGRSRRPGTAARTRCRS